MTTKPTERDLVEEVEELLAKAQDYDLSDDDKIEAALEYTKRSPELLRRLVQEVKRLRKRIKTMERDAHEDARDAAAEAHWQERQGEDYGSY